MTARTSRRSPDLAHGTLVLSRADARKLDTQAVSRYAMPSIVLMENAARHLAEVALGMVPTGARVLVVCGTGNNGGDGLAAARHLSNGGLRVDVALAGTPKTPDAATNLKITRRMGVACTRLNNVAGPSRRYALVVDAVLGTGLAAAPSGPAARAIELVQHHAEKGAKVLSADIPSGLDADTGATPGLCVRADTTVTFAGIKPGLVAGRRWVGDLWVADIGVPKALLEKLGRTVRW